MISHLLFSTQRYIVICLMITLLYITNKNWLKQSWFILLKRKPQVHYCSHQNQSNKPKVHFCFF